MDNSEKLCLKWNEFKENISSAFGDLRNDREFSDVTLACDDGTQIEAHKVILASSSPSFKDLLVKNKHQHPIIYMRRVKAEDLVAIVDFFYFGEASVFQDDLDGFLALAEDLKLEGLTGASESSSNVEQQVLPKEQQELNCFSVSHPKKATKTNSLEKPFEKTLVAINNQTVHVELGHLDEQIFSMMQQTENWIAVGRERKRVFTCNICGKEDQKTNMIKHIETNHISGVAHSCDVCGKISRSREAIRQHMTRGHMI